MMETTNGNNASPMNRRPFHDAAPDYPSVHWRAKWIWTDDPTEGKHDYVYFRREFTLKNATYRVLLRLAAQRDATLWINGELIAHGPPISDPRFQRYETHDVTKHLRTGKNCLAIRVYHSCQAPSGPFTKYATVRGLLCQLEIGEKVIVATDSSWRGRRCKAYLVPTLTMGDSMWPEWFDANQDTPGWTKVGFDDSEWPQAKLVISDAHPLWGSKQPQARFFPWVNLIPCETRPLRRERFRPAAIHTIGEVIQRREARLHDTAVRLSLEPVLPLEKTTIKGIQLLISGKGPALVQNSPLDEPDESFDGLRNATVVLDFGRLLNARFGLCMTAPGASIDIGYADRLEDGRVVPYTSKRTPLADHYIARSGEQYWETADWRHFRYVQLTFRNLAAPLTIHHVWAEATGNHFQERGQFSCDQPKLERMFSVVRRTADLCVVDRTMDNPSRERKQYLGDCSSIVSAISQCFGDCALLRRYFFNAVEGQHATGQYRYSYPGHDDDRASLFDHALSLPLRLHEHYQLFADKDLTRALWPGIERFLQLAESCLDAESRMTLPPYNIWFDWGHMDRRGFFLPLQAMTAEVFRCSAELAESLGIPGDRWSNAFERMKKRILDWFDPERGVFVDAIIDGLRQTHISEHANSLVAYYRLAPDEMIQSALDRWAENPAVFGSASPAWHYLPGAFTRAGRPELAQRWISERMDRLEKQDLETWPETWCLHGEKTLGIWRPRDSRAVTQGAGLGGIPGTLLEGFCGIHPAEPGFGVVHLVPQPGTLTRLSGRMPGPDGDYSISLKQENGDWILRLEVPSQRQIILDAAFAPDAREALIDGKIIQANSVEKLPGGLNAGRFTWTTVGKTEVYIGSQNEVFNRA